MSRAAKSFLLMDSLVLPIDLQTDYVTCWVREEGDVEDEDDLDVEKDGMFFSTSRIHIIISEKLHSFTCTIQLGKDKSRTNPRSHFQTQHKHLFQIRA